MNNTINTDNSTVRFLVQLGKALLKQKQSTNWADCETLVKLADEYAIKYDGKLSEQELDNQLRAIFQEGDELYLDGVNVVAWERRVEWALVFMVRFYSYKPGQYPCQHKELQAAVCND